jgi:trimethylamine---corrinoid protein Co-methyltransferase
VNARDAMPQGGAIVIAAREETVHAGSDHRLESGPHVCLSVTDTGEGMDEATLARATEPFFTTKGVGKGTGLGLSAVHGVMEQSGGELVLKSTKGKGTTAELWLPVASGEPAHDRIRPSAEPDQTEVGRPLVVLAVEDDSLVLMNTVAMLEDLGHSVLEATLGRMNRPDDKTRRRARPERSRAAPRHAPCRRSTTPGRRSRSSTRTPWRASSKPRSGSSRRRGSNSARPAPWRSSRPTAPRSTRTRRSSASAATSSEHFIAFAPAKIPLHSRNGDRDTWLGGNRINFNTVSSPPNVSDIERGRRPGSYEALCDLIKLNQALNVCHLVGGALVEPLDLPVPTRHLDTTYAILRYSDRPVVIRSVSAFRALDGIEMVAIGQGLRLEDMADRPSVVAPFNVNSPRRVDEELLDGLMAFAEHGQVTAITPFTLAGAMSPVTIAGALVQQTAEALAVIAFSQMVRAGAPIMLGGFTSNVDMRSGAPAFGTPEYVKAVLAGGQIARHFNLPYRSSNVNASNTVDAQSTYESAMSLWAVVMGHANLVHHGLGWLEGGLTASMEKTVIDAEMIRAWAETLTPLDVSDDALALDAIKAVPPGGHFFGEAHTLERFATAFYQPLVSDWRNFETWEEDGAKTATHAGLRDVEEPARRLRAAADGSRHRRGAPGLHGRGARKSCSGRHDQRMPGGRCIG